MATQEPLKHLLGFKGEEVRMLPRMGADEELMGTFPPSVRRQIEETPKKGEFKCKTCGWPVKKNDYGICMRCGEEHDEETGAKLSKTAAMTRKHFEAIAAIINQFGGGDLGKQALAEAFADFLATENPNFDRARFLSAATGKTSKTARRSFTKQEQQALIEEAGEARNRTKLNIEGTHYEKYDDPTEILLMMPTSL